MSRNSMLNLSKILIITSFFLFATASYLKLETRYKVEGLEIVSEEKNDSINIETPDTEEPTTEVVENSDKSKGVKKPSTNNTNNTNATKTTTKNSNNTYNTPKQKQTNNTTSITEINNNLRISIQNRYHVTVKYGSETNGYTVGGMGVKSITNNNQINTALKNLNAAMSLYPSGLYREVTSSYPLTIYLINNYSIGNVTGVTDSTNRNVKLSIATKFPFGDSFHHETYHYLELYMKNRDMSYSGWNDLNPSTFKYGVTDTDLSYARTLSSDSYFVNDYAQSSQEEDRASTFEYMMASSKASCLNKGKPIYKKAKYMADTMDFFIDACSSRVTERWERFL